MATARSFPAEVGNDPNRLTFTIAVTVIRHFSGKQYCEDQIIQDAEHSRPDGFLRLKFDAGFRERAQNRILDFAETPSNLQYANVASTFRIFASGPDR
jgi:hypothetical protein